MAIFDDVDSYDSYVNPDWNLRYQNNLDAVDLVTGGLTAAVVDFGASVWNSLPGTEETSTADLLSRIDGNALQVYNEHTDAIEAASFLGGVFVPGGLALKGMKAARAGVKGVGWFSDTGKAKALAEIDDLFRQGPAAAKQYRMAKTELLGRGIANNTLDAAAMEVAILGTMSAHPYFEDYLQDPIKNFSLSLAMGGAIGGGLGHIADRFAIRTIEGKAMTEAMENITTHLRNTTSALPRVNELQTYAANIAGLEDLLKQGDALDGLTKQIATDFLNIEKAAQLQKFDELGSSLADGLTKEQKLERLRLFSEDTRFQSVDRAELFSIQENASGTPFKLSKQQQVGGLNSNLTFAEFFNEQGDLRARVWDPVFNKIGSRRDIASISPASVLGETEKTIAAGRKEAKQYLKTADVDASLRQAALTSPELHREYLRRLDHIGALSKEELVGVVVAPDDITTINALVSRGMRNPEDVAGLTVKVGKAQPLYANEQEVASALVKEGVSSDHLKKLEPFAQRDSAYNLANSNLSAEAYDLLKRWTDGAPMDKAAVRSAFDSYFRGGYAFNQGMAKAARELYESQASNQLRTQLRTIADADGNIYMYRGIGTTPRGHAALESYTPSYKVALSFAGQDASKVRLFKIHVDDVIGVVDMHHGELEYLVGAPARQVAKKLPEQKVIRPQTKIGPGGKGPFEEVSYQDLYTRLIDLKEENLISMMKQGYPIEVISRRLDMPPSTVEAFMADGGRKTLRALNAEDGLPVLWHTDAAAIGEYLSNETRPVVLHANRNKASWAEIQATLDRRLHDNAMREIKKSILETSQSPIAKSLYEELMAPGKLPLIDIMRSQIAKATNTLAGNRFVQSSDQYMRHMGDLGQIANVVGKSVQHVANTQIKTLLEPISKQMDFVARDTGKLVEFNTAYTLNAQLRGWRSYHDRQFWQREVQMVDGKKITVEVPATFQGKEFKVSSDEVDALLTHMGTAGREIFSTIRTRNNLLGQRGMTDLGYWVPSIDPRGKAVAYVHNRVDDTTSLLWGNSIEELNDAVQAFKSANADKISRGVIDVVESKGNQELFNIMQGRDDPLTMTIANVERTHRGASASAIVPANRDILTEVIGGYERSIEANTRAMADIILSDVTDNLAKMSEVSNLALKNQPLGTIKTFLAKQRGDAANEVRNTMLGIRSLGDAPTWKSLNSSFENVMGWSLDRVSKIFKPIWEAIPKGAKKEGDFSKLDYETFSKQLETAGIVNPYAVFDDEAARIFEVAKIQNHKNTTPRLIYASNALAATSALRFGEIAQPIVNAMSLPILMTSEIAAKMPATFMGKIKGTANINPVQAMMEGVRAAYSGTNAQYDRWNKLWESAGYYEPMVSEATKVLRLTREFDKGAIATLEKAVDNSFVNLMSKPADWSEAQVRKIAMFTGGNIAKRLYPELDDTGVTIFARNFMDRVIGNYSASQRPTMFQGTLGVAMGLFQTYMLTMAQSMYRHLEIGDFKTIAKTMLAQQTIFGAGSLPGFAPISEMIGEHFSDEHFDLTTGTFRALPDEAANYVLYGLPSSMGPAFYTRGELAPRVPTGLGEAPALNMVGQIIQAVGGVADAAIGAGEGDLGRSILQGLSMQSVNRPIARISEIASRYSVTREGNTIAAPDDVWTGVGIFSRLIGTRPLEEAKLRDIIHLNTMYGSMDYEERQAVTAELKTAIRSQTLTDEKLATLADGYMRNGGTPTGWRAAVNNAIAQTETSAVGPLIKKLKPDSPFMHMMDSLDD